MLLVQATESTKVFHSSSQAYSESLSVFPPVPAEEAGKEWESWLRTMHRLEQCTGCTQQNKPASQGWHICLALIYTNENC